MSEIKTHEKQTNSWKVFGVVTFYIVAAIMMVTVNKWVLLATPMPVFFLFCQLAIAVVLLLGCHQGRLFILPSFDITVARKLWPLIIINVLGLTFNTICLQYVDASFYQVARGLVLPIAVSLSFATGQLPPSPRALMCCVVVTLGFLVGALLEQHSRSDQATSFIGILFGILSSCTTAIHSMVIKSSLGAVHNSAVDLAWYTNLLSTIVIFPFVLVVGERNSILHMLVTPEERITFLIGTAITGVFGFLICVAGFLSIKVTSPVTHMVSSAARSVIQTVFGVVLFHDILSRPRAGSILIIMVGSCAYVLVKHREMLQARRQEHPYEPTPNGEEDDEEAAMKEVGGLTGLRNEHGDV